MNTPTTTMRTTVTAMANEQCIGEGNTRVTVLGFLRQVNEVYLCRRIEWVVRLAQLF